VRPDSPDHRQRLLDQLIRSRGPVHHRPGGRRELPGIGLDRPASTWAGLPPDWEHCYESSMRLIKISMVQHHQFR
jgi:hypothetical protein